MDPTIKLLTNNRDNYESLRSFPEKEDVLSLKNVKISNLNDESTPIEVNAEIKSTLPPSSIILANIDFLLSVIDVNVIPSEEDVKYNVVELYSRNEDSISSYLNLRSGNNVKLDNRINSKKSYTMIYSHSSSIVNNYDIIKLISEKQANWVIIPLSDPKNELSINFAYILNNISVNFYAFKPLSIDSNNDNIIIAINGIKNKSLLNLQQNLKEDIIVKFNNKIPIDFIDYINRYDQQRPYINNYWKLWFIWNIPSLVPNVQYHMKETCTPYVPKKLYPSPLINHMLTYEQKLNKELEKHYVPLFQKFFIDNLRNRVNFISLLHKYIGDEQIVSKWLLSQRLIDLYPKDDVIPSFSSFNLELTKQLTDIQYTEDKIKEVYVFIKNQLNRFVKSYNPNVDTDKVTIKQENNHKLISMDSDMQVYKITNEQYNLLEKRYKGDKRMFLFNIYSLYNRYKSYTDVFFIPEKAMKEVNTIYPNQFSFLTAPYLSNNSPYYSLFETSDLMFGSKGHPLSKHNNISSYEAGGSFLFTIPETDYYYIGFKKMVEYLINNIKSPLFIVLLMIKNDQLSILQKANAIKTLNSREHIFKEVEDKMIEIGFFFNAEGEKKYNITENTYNSFYDLFIKDRYEEDEEYLLSLLINQKNLNLFEIDLLKVTLPTVDPKSRINILDYLIKSNNDQLSNYFDGEYDKYTIVNPDIYKLDKNSITTEYRLYLFKLFIQFSETATNDVLTYWYGLINYSPENYTYDSFTKFYEYFSHFLHNLTIVEYEEFIDVIS